jgi:hypothetical protein
MHNLSLKCGYVCGSIIESRSLPTSVVQVKPELDPVAIISLYLPGTKEHTSAMLCYTVILDVTLTSEGCQRETSPHIGRE